MDYCNRNLYAYDSDNDGSDTYYFAFSSGKFFKVLHEWSWTYGADRYLDNNFEITEVKEEETKNLCGDRDYLVLKSK
jgi:hypothetical protein